MFFVFLCRKCFFFVKFEANGVVGDDGAGVGGNDACCYTYYNKCKH